MQSSTDFSDVITRYRNRLEQAIERIDESEIDQFALELLGARQRGSTIFLAGNGGSASTVNHYAIDWALGTEVDNPPFRVLSLSESVASLSATGNDKTFDLVFARPLRRLGEEGDVLVVVSASGNSPNLLAAVSVAQEKGVRVVAVTGFDGGKLKSLADVSVHIPTALGDYGVAEDLHLSVGHIIKEMLIAAVSNE